MPYQSYHMLLFVSQIDIKENWFYMKLLPGLPYPYCARSWLTLVRDCDAISITFPVPFCSVMAAWLGAFHFFFLHLLLWLIPAINSRDESLVKELVSLQPWVIPAGVGGNFGLWGSADWQRRFNLLNKGLSHPFVYLVVGEAAPSFGGSQVTEWSCWQGF